MKKNNHLYIVLCIIFLLLLSLPWIQMKTQLFKLRPLQGVYVVAEKKTFSWDGFREGSYQQAAEAYLSDHFGFREWLFRTYNQYVWSCFGTWNTFAMRMSHDHWLFWLDDVNDYYYGLGCYDSPDSASTVQRYNSDSHNLFLLQQILRDYGVHLFVCIAPSKSHTCSEHIPEPIPNYYCNHPNAYPYFVDRFIQLGLNHIDFNAYFHQLKGLVDYPLYYKFSSHWSNLAVCHMGDTLMRYLEHLGNIPLPHIEVGEEYVDSPHDPDDDLVGVTNIWFPIDQVTYRYADVTLQSPKDVAHPRMLAIGDSYCQGLHRTLPFDKIFSQYHYWYYFHNIECDSIHQQVDQVDLLDEVLNIDYLMVIWCPINIYKLGHGFPERALVNLCVDDSVVAARFRQEVAAIQADTAQMASLHTQANQNGLTLNQAIVNEVYNRFYAHPDLYFKELCGEGVPVARNRRIALVRNDANLSSQDRLRADIRRKIQNDIVASQNLKSYAEEHLISYEEAFANEVERILKSY